MATVLDAPPDGAVADAKAYLRIDGADEDALVATLVLAALELFERFTGAATLLADRTAILPPAAGCWLRLPLGPVEAITAMTDAASGVAVSRQWSSCISADGTGLVRVVDPGAATRLAVAYRAGLASDWPALPAAVRQGVVRLAGHLHAHRDEAGDAGPPAAVAALWRPWRRVRL